MNYSAGSYRAPESVNALFDQEVIVDCNTLPWFKSPQAGVERHLLDRIGREVARATSLVKYACHSSFPAHKHTAGEEFLVLKGTFCDEHGSYPTGTYVRNPPGSQHTPFTNEGCVILVKLRQMHPGGEPRLSVDTSALDWQTAKQSGHFFKHLFTNDHEDVKLEKLTPGTSLDQDNCGGIEIFILSGTLFLHGKTQNAGSWLRLPATFIGTLTSETGTGFWVKRGHLHQ